MPRSRAFEDFIEQSKVTGRQKLDGYNPDLLNQIYPEERSEVEDIVVGLCLRGDPDVAIFLPYLRKYDGIELLKKKLSESIIPSWTSIQCALTLFKETGEDDFLDILKKNLEYKQYRLDVLGALKECIPSDKICKIFQDRCINDDDPVVRISAATGILYCRGIIQNPFALNNVNNNRELYKSLTNGNAEIRRRNVEELM